MATYAIGDIQGCLNALQRLLGLVAFDPSQDELWILGDLVNRGPQSLETLRYVKSLPSVKMVLGNHDLHLLAAAAGHKSLGPKDTLKPILEASDRTDLLNWLRHQPLVHHDSVLGFTMVHAGIPPIWSIKEALKRAREVEQVLQNDSADDFFAHMYGNSPSVWSDGLAGQARLRVITNYFTRMRFCTSKGKLELNTKTGPRNAPEGYAPWFDHANHKCHKDKVLFGHWASLQGQSHKQNFIALDTGCVWGGQLLALRLEDAVSYSVPCECSNTSAKF